ncbi:MAG: 50S ribosomal protein L6 [Candidatus Latescibacterota bacterium]|nr:50S ribosomal protein L6 [Candidatus Korarchaeota archaeon]RKY67748.1 MAG: 50S ribosomal protein L6 [Candidatus Latescibacterota bacterium]
MSELEFLTDEKAILEAIKHKNSIMFYWEEIEIPDNVNVEIVERKVKVSGPKGTVEKDFSHVRSVYILREGNKIYVACYARKNRDRKPLRTISSKIKRMIDGVLSWYVYKHKVMFAHFPIRVRVEGRNIVIENFYGRKGKMKVPIYGDQTVVEITLQPGSDVPDEVIIKGPDLEAVSQTSGILQESCKLRGKLKKDPRRFQDGIWRYEILRE